MVLGQPLRMADHVSDWGELLNPHCREDKRLTMVVMFVGCLMLGDDLNIVTMWMRRCNEGCIAQWSTSQASQNKPLDASSR